MITRDEGRGVGGASASAPAGHGGRSEGATDTSRSGDRARANLALLYGGAGRRPLGRVVVDPSERHRELARDEGSPCC